MNTNNWKLKYQGLVTSYVYKDHTNIKNVLKKKTIVIFKKGSMLDLNIGYWDYESPTVERLVSWNPPIIKTVKIKNPKIVFYIDHRKLYYKKDAFHLMPFEFIKKSDYDILSELVHPVSPYKHNISEDFSLIDSISREDIIKRFLYINYYDDLINRTSDCIGINVILTYVAETTMELLIEK